MKTKKCILHILLLSCFMVGFNLNLSAQQTISGSFSSGAETRSYIGAVPNSPQTSLRLVILFCGVGEDASQMELRGFNDFLGDNTMVIYPQPFSTMAGFGNSAGVDDIQMVEDLIANVATDYTIDLNDICIGGFSNGGIFTYRLVCDFNSPSSTRAYSFKSFAVVSGAMPDGEANTTDCPIAGSLPMIAFHGTDDPLIQYNGGFVFPINFTAEATDTTINFWATSINGCSTPPTATTLADSVIEAQAPSTVERLEYGCRESGKTVFYRIDGGLHAWPGGNGTFDIQQDRNRDINASKLIAEFFEAEESVPTSILNDEWNMINDLVSVFPNPVNDVLTISTTVHINQIEILNAMGKTVLAETQPNHSISLEGLTSGIYFLKAESEEGFTVVRIIKN